MNYYQRKKAQLQAEAMDHQREASELSLSWWDVADYCEQLEKEARKYGLLKEFKLNGIL